VFERHSNIKFYENSSGGSRAVHCGQTDGDRWVVMTKLIFAFYSYANAPKDESTAVE